MIIRSEPLPIGLTHLTIDTGDTQLVFDSGITLPIYPQVFSRDWMPLIPCDGLVISGGIAEDSCLLTVLKPEAGFVVQMGIGNGNGANEVWSVLNKDLPSALSRSIQCKCPITTPWLAVRFHSGFLSLGLSGAMELAGLEQVLTFSFLRYKQRGLAVQFSTEGNRFSWDGKCGKGA